MHQWKSAVVSVLVCVLTLAVIPLSAQDSAYAVDAIDDAVLEPLKLPEGSIDGPPAPAPPDIVSRDDRGGVTLRAIRLSDPLVVDGKLEESAYRRIPSIDGFIQQEPREGEPATERTEVWVFFDKDNVYVAARCWGQPSRTYRSERDAAGQP